MLGVDQVFLETGDNLVFEDEAHLRAFLDFVLAANSPWVPPGRNDGRTTAHRERYCLRYFLAQEAARFAYPISVEKTERPDFVITDGAGRRIGVEHTDAGPEAFQRWLAQNEHRAEAQLFPDREGRDNPDGFAGGQAFAEAAVDIVSALLNKMESINKAGYQDADAYVLIIYLLSHAPLFFAGDVEDILARLPSMDSVRGEAPSALSPDAAGKSFERALIVVNGRARYWS